MLLKRAIFAEIALQFMTQHFFTWTGQKIFKFDDIINIR